MASFTIQGGAKVEIPQRDEIRDDMRGAIAERDRQHARGFKPMRVSGPGPSPAASTLYIAYGPESGYLWNLKLISVQLASAGTVLAYITSGAPGAGSTPQRLIANMSTSNVNQVVTFSSSQVMLLPDESVYLSATQNISAWFLAAAEVPAEMAWKAYD